MGLKATVRHDLASTPVRALKVEITQGPDAEKSLTASSDTLTVGTAKDNDLVLTDETVSRYHLELRRVRDGIEIEDLGSTNGVQAGSVRVVLGRIGPGAQVRLGKTVLRVDEGDPISVELHETDDFFGFRGRSATMRRVMGRLRRVAQSDASVLLQGETGVGKEIAARAVHEASARADAPYETVDCGALAPTLIASELFGHEKGAFTGADRQYVGAFERANGGTLFLDEIGELPQRLQTNLLGALERRRFRRLGGDKSIEVDVRLITATHRDLRAEVNAGSFRDDLYFRIAVVRLAIPPLRERTEDIPILVEHFLRQCGYASALEDIVPAEVLDELREYRWPGNVRELRNFVEATLAMGEAKLDRVDSERTEDLPPKTGSGFPTLPLSELFKMTYRDARAAVSDEFEALYVAKALEEADGNVSEAARAAEIHRTYLMRMLKRHGLK